MKLKITEKGVNITPSVKGMQIQLPEGRDLPENFDKLASFSLPVGTIVVVDSMPRFLINKCVDIDAGHGKETASPSLDEEGLAERAALFLEACRKLSEDDFTADGKPDVAAVNKQIGSAEHFNAVERNQLWDVVGPILKAD